MKELNEISTIEDILGEGFGDDLSSAIREAREEKQLDAAIDYNFFVEHMLPVIAGKETDPVFIQKWVAFLGGPNVTANIIRNGELYLTIPPVVPQLKFNPNSEKVPPHAVFDEYSKMATINPTLATHRLLEKVQEWHASFTLEDLYLDMVKWNQVFEENGYPIRDLSGLELIVKPEVVAQAATNKQVNESTSDANDLFGEEW